MIRHLFVLIIGTCLGLQAQADCPTTDTWARALDPGPAVPSLRDVMKTDSGKEVFVYNMSMSGDGPVEDFFAKSLVFLVLSRTDGGVCIEEAVTLGRRPSLSKDGKDYFILGLYRGERHATLEQFDEKPPLDTVKELARQALN